MPAPREKSVDELMEEMERSAHALGVVPDVSESLGDGIETALASRSDAEALARPEAWADMDAAAAGARSALGGAAQSVVVPRANVPGPSEDVPLSGTPESRRAALLREGKPPPMDEEWRAAQRPSSSAAAPLARPRRRGDAPEWDELLRDARVAAVSGRVHDAGNDMLAQMGPPGWQFRSGKSVQPEVAALPLQMAQARQDFEQRELSADAQRARLEADEASRNPASPQSQRAREAWRAMGLPTPDGFDEWSAADLKNLGAGDFSLAERRKALTEEARNRSELSRLQLEALERERGHKRELDERKQDELERYHRALESKWKKTGGPHPVTKVRPGEIDTVPAQFREVVKAIAEGRAEAPKPGSRFGADILKYVVAYKPDFDATKYNAYKKVVEQQATGKDVVAIDVGLEHLKTARSLIPKNANPQFVNRVKQAIASGSGDPEYAPFIAASTVAAHELAKIYNIEDQAGKHMVEQMLGPAQSPEQLAAVFNTLVELVEGKERGLARQRERVAPSSAPAAPHGVPAGSESAAPKTVRLRRKSDGAVAPVSEAAAKKLLASGKYEEAP